MKIVILQHTAMLGGASKSLIDLAHMLMEKHEVIVCLPKEAVQSSKLLNGLGISTKIISAKIPTWLYYSGGSGIVSKKTLDLIKRMKKNNVNVFVKEIEDLNPELLIFNSIVSCITAKYFNKNLVKIGIIRETFNRTLIDNKYRNIFRKHLDGLCSIAKSELEYIHISEIKQCVIPDCLTPNEIKINSKEEACKTLGVSESDYNILFLGGLDLIKGTDVLLRSLRYIEGNVHIIIAGNFNKDMLKHDRIKRLLLHPKAYRFFRNVNEDYNLFNNRITLLGFQTEGLSSAYCASNVLVFPSTYPHQPRPCIEAGAYSKPVILSDYNVTKEYFVDGYNALTFQPRNPIDLANKIKSLMDNRELENYLGYNNKQMTESKHNYYATQEKLLLFVESVVNSKSQNAGVINEE